MKIPIVSERTDEVRVSFRYRLQRNGTDRPFTEATVAWTTREGQERAYSGIAYIHPNVGRNTERMRLSEELMR